MSSSLIRCALIALILALTGCATRSGPDYAALRQSKPKSIVVLPPINNSPDLRGSYSFLSTVTWPLAEAGYYVFPVVLVDQTFRENGMSLPPEMHQAPLAKIGEIFGADAALFITVEDYGARYMVVDSAVIVTASARLMDTRTGQLLWQGKARASNAENRGTGGGLTGMLISAIIQQVANSIGDQGRNVARVTSSRMFWPKTGGLLYGPRSPHYLKD